MAITTYAQLQTAVQTWLDRTDISASVPDLITLFEAAAQRNLRVRDMVATSSFTTSGGSATLPSDMLQVISVRRMGSPVTTLSPLEDEEFNRLYGTLSAGTPSSYMISGSTIYIAPVDDTTTMKLNYYQLIPVLSNTNTSNWLLTKYPDLYLFGALTEAELFAADGTSAAVWKNRRDEIMNEIQKTGQFNYRGPSPQIRIQGINP